jgi:hypothetical protein
MVIRLDGHERYDDCNPAGGLPAWCPGDAPEGVVGGQDAVLLQLRPQHIGALLRLGPRSLLRVVRRHIRLRSVHGSVSEVSVVSQAAEVQQMGGIAEQTVCSPYWNAPAKRCFVFSQPPPDFAAGSREGRSLEGRRWVPKTKRDRQRSRRLLSDSGPRPPSVLTAQGSEQALASMAQNYTSR